VNDVWIYVSSIDVLVGKCLLLLQAAICRCSQPLSGFSARCMEDESLLQAIRKANSSSKYMFVVDMRPKASCICTESCFTDKSPSGIVKSLDSYLN